TAHPNSDRLVLCDVATGAGNCRVVCGAPNVKEGLIVPLAKVGSSIPGGYTIKRSAIRGIESEGMLCSEEELGIGDDSSGIMVLPENLDLGQDLAVALDLTDQVFDIGVTPNRSDCLSIMGIAREIAAITGVKLRYPVIEFQESDEEISSSASVDILNPELCPRYTARLIKNITIKPSPAWMRLRLEAVGLRAINNAVDVTNFVMMETGQPLHAFDFKFLEEGRIVVRGAAEGEEFTSLDGKKRILRGDTLMICDGRKPVAVAGVMGGLNSEVVEDTEAILLESAYFSPKAIRRSARQLGMATDASFRFERGVDPEGVVRALNRAAQLLAEVAGGTVVKNHIDSYPRKIESVAGIPLRVKRVNDILGMSISAGTMRDILGRLEMIVEEREPGNFTVTPPTFRADITREIDLIEEISRLYGYDKIPLSLPAVVSPSGEAMAKAELLSKIRSVLNGFGYQEVINYSFITPLAADLLGLPAGDKGRRMLAIRNPLTEEASVMRTSLVYGLLETMRKNANAGSGNLKIFETGKVFYSRGEEQLPEEEERLAGLITGSRYDVPLYAGEGEADFYDCKGAVEALLAALGMENVSFRSSEEGNRCCLHPGRSSEIIAAGASIGCLGEVHREVRERMDLRERACIFELNMGFLAGRSSKSVVFSEVPRYPSVARDVAFLISEDVTAADLIARARRHAPELLEQVAVFDVYQGKGIPEGLKSLAVRFVYRSSKKTLMDSEVNDIHNQMIQAVATETEAKIRGLEQ
ncbi:MAG: phenylalanine--tRNA ligase subunit beta, partial [Deltaproteobacteria bacterium]|nr:phenylalanine--tRNA ligase subunit beta [Deltaproteobacteria bacterium]